MNQECNAGIATGSVKVFTHVRLLECVNSNILYTLRQVVTGTLCPAITIVLFFSVCLESKGASDKEWKQFMSTASDSFAENIAKQGVGEAEAKAYRKVMIEMGNRLVGALPDKFRRQIELAALQEHITNSFNSININVNHGKGLAEGKAFMSGVVIGMITDALHKQIDGIEGDTFKPVFLKEQLHFWLDIAEETVGAVPSSSGYAVQAKLVYGYGKATAARVVKAVNTAKEARKAINAAKLSEEEVEMWGAVLSAYARFATATNPSDRKRFEKEMDDRLADYGMWVDRLRWRRNFFGKQKFEHVRGYYINSLAHKQQWVAKKQAEIYMQDLMRRVKEREREVEDKDSSRQSNEERLRDDLADGTDVPEHITYTGTYGTRESGMQVEDSRFDGNALGPKTHQQGLEAGLTKTNVSKTTLSSSTHNTWGRWNGRVESTGIFGETNAVLAANQRGYWIAGRITPAENIPMSGSATYNGDLVGTAEIGRMTNSAEGTITPGTFHDLTGDFVMNVDFGNGSVSSELSNVGYQTASGRVTVIGSNGTGDLLGSFNRADSSLSIDAQYNSGDFTRPFHTLKVLMDGHFYGTNADAVGGSFRILNNDSINGTTIDANGIFYSTSSTRN